MHEGFVNFNAGTLGTSMVEGRISAGVVVGDGSDIGGGASIMGTLSGGGKRASSPIGERCLLGAEAGIGIALGDDCVVEAGLYVTAGTQVTLPDGADRQGPRALRRRRTALPPQLRHRHRRGPAVALGGHRAERRPARQLRPSGRAGLPPLPGTLADRRRRPVAIWRGPIRCRSCRSTARRRSPAATSPSTDRAANADADRGDRRAAGSARDGAVSIALATAYQESKIRNLSGGDRDSVGLFQQRPSQGWGTVAQIRDEHYAINKFYDALVKIDGYETMRITEAAQKVQRSGYPEAYEVHAPDARALASALDRLQPRRRLHLRGARAEGHGTATAATTSLHAAFGDLTVARTGIAPGLHDRGRPTAPPDNRTAGRSRSTWSRYAGPLKIRAVSFDGRPGVPGAPRRRAGHARARRRRRSPSASAEPGDRGVDALVGGGSATRTRCAPAGP